MPKDALTIYRAACELDFLVGGKVDKVNMPNADTLILLFHTSVGNHRLLLSCNPSLPRVHVTRAQYKNPETATGTLMYFRKRLAGAILVGIEKDKCERMITFKFSALDELRERVEYSLIAELTGKCANIVFVESDGAIGNCLRRISSEAPGKRAVLPGLTYTLPTPTGRVGVFDRAELSARINAFDGVSARIAADKCVAGLATATVNELFFGLNIADGTPVSDAVTNAFIDAAQALYDAPLSPVVTFDGDKPSDYFIMPYKTVGGRETRFDTLNAAMDEYYSKLFAAADLAAYVKPLKAAVKSATSKNKKRLADAAAKLNESAEAESDRRLGELITANIYKIKRGDVAVEVDNYFDENGGTVTLKLDPMKNAQQNAAAYYKSYTKKKKAAVYAQDALDKAKAALDRLDGISLELELCTEKRELDEVREELVALGLIKPVSRRTKAKPVPSEPYAFDIDGVTLLIGKNSAQNDRITRGAQRTDTWLHVKDAHGCHAVLKTPRPTDEQLVRAAEKAAYYSQARAADKVTVDYTLIKHVYPHGGGRVDYKEYKSLVVTPKA